MNLPTPQYVLPVYLCRFAVRVAMRLVLSGFSREYGYRRYWLPPEGTPYCQVRLKERICLPLSAPTPFNGDFRRPAAVSLLRLHIARMASDGMLTVSAIALSIRMRLRARLTPG